jgi:carbohydrate-selective porin OprB
MSVARASIRHSMRRFPPVALTIALMACMAGPGVVLAETQAPETFGGDVWSRPRITGDWFGYRDDLAKHGVTLDVDYLQILQGVISGGLENDVGYWGSVDYRLDVDTGKLGLWPGGFLNVHAMSSYGTSVNAQAGALVRVNGAALFPRRRRRPAHYRAHGAQVHPVSNAVARCLHWGRLTGSKLTTTPSRTIGEPSS